MSSGFWTHFKLFFNLIFFKALLTLHTLKLRYQSKIKSAFVCLHLAPSQLVWLHHNSLKKQMSKLNSIIMFWLTLAISPWIFVFCSRKHEIMNVFTLSLSSDQNLQSNPIYSLVKTTQNNFHKTETVERFKVSYYFLPSMTPKVAGNSFDQRCLGQSVIVLL